MIVTLTITKGEDTGKVFRIGDGETKIIGRSSHADIILQDVSISRQHCRVHTADGSLRLADLNSKNGTALNGRRIAAEVVVGEQDVLEIGTTTLKVRISSGPGVPDSVSAPVEVSEAPAEDAEIEAPPFEIDLEPSPPAPATEENEESLMGAFERYLDRAQEGELETELGRERVEPIIEPPPESSPLPEPRSLSGTLIGGCRVEELLGADPVSQIYRATQISMERVVALKILSPRMTHDSRAVERFIQAARAGGKLTHPNIVQIYDAGEENGIYFIALELVDGRSLREALREHGANRPFGLDPAVRVADQIAGALEYAHGQSVIHGNVAPDNVYLTWHDVAKLADLGFSKSLADSGIERPTHSGDRLDGLCFTAPEQLSDARSATARSDIYSLGAVLFFMLTGRIPFRGGSEREMRERILKGDRERIPRLRRDAPEELVKIVDRAMARLPSERQAHAAELQEDLSRFRARLRG